MTQERAGRVPLTVLRAGGPGAAVVVMPSAFGVTPDLIAQLEDLARDASLVVTFDPFHGADAGVAPYEDMKRVMARLNAYDAARGREDVAAVIDWTRRASDGRPVVMVGICFGGPFALLAAADGQIDAMVTWHGSRMERLVDRAADVRCPARLHFGSVDPVTPPGAIEAVRAAFGGHPDARIVIHEGATHGFTHRNAPAFQAAAEHAAVDDVRALVRL